MAAPASKTVTNLNGTWVLNKTLSDPTDPALSLQGVGWLLRKGISAATVTIVVKQYPDPETSTTTIDIDQSASGVTSTKELRRLDWNSREHKDFLFGRVHGRSKYITLSELKALISPEGEARKEKWVENDFLAEDWLETDGEEGKLVLSHVVADAGWFATQVWGFQDVGGERRYVRNVVVAKEDTFVNFKMIYDFVSE
ncbi:hypothetical protein F5B22DRAFT_537032 [Xylaria bambusicola]|uniref:uncharacterized protein n=1 Tax=Xylaria bambusicola TaxID=326684 RepID=UPI0020072543|nr:uncharacterized protein F5B22DRAFT_537032 [Xylaria bambusicola]KAI0505106.1 hypothetical protein F5B22DRAFT_537032 [Xylaria bambusicola]